MVRILCLSSGYTLSTEERLLGLNGKWESIEQMQTLTKWFATISLRGTVLVIGGNNGANKLKSVQRFDTDMMKWKYVKDLNILRSSHSACVYMVSLCRWRDECIT